jgi:hypothetical protein
MPDSIEEIAQRLERAADRCHNSADFQAERDAQNAAAQVRRASSVLEAQQIERNFMNAHLAATPGGAPAYQDLSQNQGCLTGWFGNVFGGRRSTSGPWRSTTAGVGPQVRMGGGRSYYHPWSVYPHFSSSSYAHYTLAHAVGRHLPPGYSDPQAYAQQLANQTGLDPNMQIGDLTPTQLASLTDAIDSNPNWRQSDSLPDIAAGTSTQEISDTGGRSTYQSSDVSSGSDFGSVATAAPSDNS